MLLLDSEGQFSIERSDNKFDRRLTTFCMTVSNFLMLNIKGDLFEDMSEVLETAVYTIGRSPTLSMFAKSPRFHIVLRD